MARERGSTPRDAYRWRSLVVPRDSSYASGFHFPWNWVLPLVRRNPFAWSFDSMCVNAVRNPPWNSHHTLLISSCSTLTVCSLRCPRWETNNGTFGTIDLFTIQIILPPIETLMREMKKFNRCTVNRTTKEGRKGVPRFYYSRIRSHYRRRFRETSNRVHVKGSSQCTI